jgi:hypothetical protein
VHWDETIARYNLAHKNSIPVDVKFLLTLSDKTLPVLERNADVLDSKNSMLFDMGDRLYSAELTPRAMFELRKKEFLETQKTYSWLSWNVADAYVKRNLSGGRAMSSGNY